MIEQQMSNTFGSSRSTAGRAASDGESRPGPARGTSPVGEDHENRSASWGMAALASGGGLLLGFLAGILVGQQGVDHTTTFRIFMLVQNGLGLLVPLIFVGLAVICLVRLGQRLGRNEALELTSHWGGLGGGLGGWRLSGAAGYLLLLVLCAALAAATLRGTARDFRESAASSSGQDRDGRSDVKNTQNSNIPKPPTRTPDGSRPGDPVRGPVSPPAHGTPGLAPAKDEPRGRTGALDGTAP